MVSTKEALHHHLKCFGEGDLNGILSGYAPGAILFTPDGPLRGTDAMRPLFQAMIADFGKPGAVFSMKQESIEGEYAYILRTAEFGAPFAPLGAGPRVLRVALEEPIGFSSSRSSNSRQNLTPIHLSSELEEQHEIESRRCSTRPRFDLHDARRLFDKWPVPSPSHRPLW